MSDRLKVLDLFCGMGGWSVGFHREGFECFGIDIVDVGYPYDFAIGDVRVYHPRFSPDVLVMSPPCTEFSDLTRISHAKGQRGAPDPMGPKGIGLIREAIRVRDEAQPHFWILENVFRSIPFISSLLGEPMLIAKPWVLWGNLPASLFEYEVRRRGDVKLSHSFEHNGKGTKHKSIMGPEDFPFDPLRSWRRARIPVWLAQSVAKWCKSTILEAVESQP